MATLNAFVSFDMSKIDFNELYNLSFDWAFYDNRFVNGRDADTFTIDYEAGTFKRPPAWITEWGFEWLYRLLREPAHGFTATSSMNRPSSGRC